MVDDEFALLANWIAKRNGTDFLPILAWLESIFWSCITFIEGGWIIG